MWASLARVRLLLYTGMILYHFFYQKIGMKRIPERNKPSSSFQSIFTIRLCFVVVVVFFFFALTQSAKDNVNTPDEGRHSGLK